MAIRKEKTDSHTSDYESLVRNDAAKVTAREIEIEKQGGSMKNWFLERFLPMWAKETVLADNRQLKRENRALQQQLKLLESYTRGLESGIRAGRKINIYGGKQ